MPGTMGKRPWRLIGRILASSQALSPDFDLSFVSELVDGLADWRLDDDLDVVNGVVRRFVLIESAVFGGHLEGVVNERAVFGRQDGDEGRQIHLTEHVVDVDDGAARLVAALELGVHALVGIVLDDGKNLLLRKGLGGARLTWDRCDYCLVEIGVDLLEVGI